MGEWDDSYIIVYHSNYYGLLWIIMDYYELLWIIMDYYGLLGLIIVDYYGSFPHSLQSTSKKNHLEKQRIALLWQD